MSDLNDKVDEYTIKLKTAVESAEHHVSDDSDRMTGRNFYQSFKAELDKYDRLELETKAGLADFMHLDSVLEAAKRAANITGESK